MNATDFLFSDWLYLRQAGHRALEKTRPQRETTALIQHTVQVPGHPKAIPLLSRPHKILWLLPGTLLLEVKITSHLSAKFRQGLGDDVMA